MAKYEEKFIVFNRKHIAKLPLELRIQFDNICMKIREQIPSHSYYVCNRDEPYAKDVFDIILAGETLKEKEITLADVLKRAKGAGLTDDDLKLLRNSTGE